MKEQEYTMETRTVVDGNGFTVEQIRFLPVEDWEPNDGWRTTRYISCSKS